MEIPGNFSPEMGPQTERLLRNKLELKFSYPTGGFGIVAPCTTADPLQETYGEQFITDRLNAKGFAVTSLSFSDLATANPTDAISYTVKRAEEHPADYKGAVILGGASKSGLFNAQVLSAIPRVDILSKKDNDSYEALVSNMRATRMKVLKEELKYGQLLQDSDPEVKFAATTLFLSDSLGGLTDRQSLSYENKKHAKIPLIIVAPTDLHAAAVRSQLRYGATRWDYLYAATMSGINIHHPKEEDFEPDSPESHSALMPFYGIDPQAQTKGVEMLVNGLEKIQHAF